MTLFEAIHHILLELKLMNDIIWPWKQLKDKPLQSFMTYSCTILLKLYKNYEDRILLCVQAKYFDGRHVDSSTFLWVIAMGDSYLSQYPRGKTMM